MGNISQSFLNTHDEIHIIIREAFGVQHLLTHNITFEFMNKGITLDLALTTYNVGVGLDDIA